ncbi:MAG: DUF1343 domain-containing protein [Rikenellaceae bacterium]
MQKILHVLLLALATTFIYPHSVKAKVVVGAERVDQYIKLLDKERVAIFSNHTGMVGDKHTLDILIEEGVNVVAIFSPEHGFRGSADAGEHVSNSIDTKTGVPILSLYSSKSKKNGERSMTQFDTLVIDIQDVGLRFYTYYISMMQLMNLCAEESIDVVLLDRPNPNGHYVDGPILDMERCKSGVGALPIPVVHGMTLGELAQMINGEEWLDEGQVCNLTVIPCRNYTHQTMYEVPVPPSPNLPNMKSIYLYPSTCLFEGTPLSLGRGTDYPFQIYGHPDFEKCDFSFTPHSRVGATSPPLMDQLCYGVDLRGLSNREIWKKGIDLSYVIDGYRKLNIGERYFGAMFDLLIGQQYVREMIVDGCEAEEIEAMWQNDVDNFKRLRQPYIIYK